MVTVALLINKIAVYGQKYLIYAKIVQKVTVLLKNWKLKEVCYEKITFSLSLINWSWKLYLNLRPFEFHTFLHVNIWEFF